MFTPTVEPQRSNLLSALLKAYPFAWTDWARTLVIRDQTKKSRTKPRRCREMRARTRCGPELVVLALLRYPASEARKGLAREALE